MLHLRALAQWAHILMQCCGGRCIVNGPGEMADADFGYVGGAPGKIDLYVGKEVLPCSSCMLL